ncbi:MAG: hypothetical protein K9N11_07230 [Lentisphaeria bacterium]|nr:hypothetical protein [Candidatus Neomarinimicrobiota bacterium]MCF7842629.1 hypothetical protein [Lentisphaeria bacterium]
MLLCFVLALCAALGQEMDSTVTVNDTIPSRNPKTALYLSLIPGGGQLYNGQYLKALIFSGAFVYYTQRYQKAAKAYEESGLSSDHRTRNDQAWMMGLTWALGLIDAYVDAQLYNFDRYTVEGATAVDSLETGKDRNSGR